VSRSLEYLDYKLTISWDKHSGQGEVLIEINLIKTNEPNV
jgi:hypothetical protein